MNSQNVESETESAEYLAVVNIQLLQRIREVKSKVTSC